MRIKKKKSLISEIEINLNLCGADFRADRLVAAFPLDGSVADAHGLVERLKTNSNILD